MFSRFLPIFEKDVSWYATEMIPSNYTQDFMIRRIHGNNLLFWKTKFNSTYKQLLFKHYLERCGSEN